MWSLLGREMKTGAEDSEWLISQQMGDGGEATPVEQLVRQESREEWDWR